MAMKAACPILNCPVLKMSVKPMAAMAQIPLDMIIDKVITLVENSGKTMIRRTNSPPIDLGMAFLMSI